MQQSQGHFQLWQSRKEEDLVSFVRNESAAGQGIGFAPQVHKVIAD